MTLKKLSPLIPLVMLPLGLWLGYRAFRGRSLADIAESVAAIPAGHLALAFAFAAASYLCLTGFDWLALRYVGRPLPYWQSALTSFVSLSIGHNVGVAALSSGTLRYRFYSGFGLGVVEVGKLILFCGVTVGLGLMTLGGLLLAARPDFAAAATGLAPGAARAAGGLLLALSALYLLAARRIRRPLVLRGHRFALPELRIAAAQLALGTVNFAFVAACLHQLMAAGVSYPEAASAYVLANIAGLVTHVPGGLGVLEYVIATTVAHVDVAGTLIAFRIVYYFVPLALGSLILAAAEIVRWRGGLAVPATTTSPAGSSRPHPR